MFKVILVATDGSVHGSKASDTAASIAGKFGARLVILSVVQPGPLPRAVLEVSHRGDASSPHPLLANVPSWFDQAQSSVARGTGEAHALIEALARRAINYAVTRAEKEGVPSHMEVIEHGDPTQRILEYADREDADLIVLGRRGLGSFAELMGGSVSHKVTHATDRSCLTVK